MLEYRIRLLQTKPAHISFQGSIGSRNNFHGEKSICRSLSQLLLRYIWQKNRINRMRVISNENSLHRIDKICLTFELI